MGSPAHLRLSRRSLLRLALGSSIGAAAGVVGWKQAGASSPTPRVYLPFISTLPIPGPPAGRFGYGLNLADIGTASVVKQLGFGYVKGYATWASIETAPGQYEWGGVEAYQYAFAHWPWMGPMLLFNLDFSASCGCAVQDPMRFYAILNSDGSPRPAFTALAQKTKPVR